MNKVTLLHRTLKDSEGKACTREMDSALWNKLKTSNSHEWMLCPPELIEASKVKKSVEERIAAIESAESKEAVEALLEGESSVKVKKAAAKKIKEYEQD